MKVIEHIIGLYYIYRNIIFGGVCICFLIVILKYLGLNIRRGLNRLLYKCVQINMIFALGIVFKILGLTVKIEYDYFNVAIFLYLVIILSVYELIQSILFKNKSIPIQQMCRYMQYIVFFEIFLLTITSHLEVVEFVIGILVILSFDAIPELIEVIYGNKTVKKVSKESDYPNPDLYPTRKRQLENFVPVLEQQKQEPYAIMISGEWGQGKTSFVKALEEKIKSDVFIWIRAGSEKSVSEIMLEISERILEALKENGVLIERESLIEKYFLSFTELLDETGLRLFNNFANIFFVNKEYDLKEYISNKLGELGKTIYLIIDDLDRCDQEYQQKMFKVIRESTELNNCKTIFLVDKSIFLKGNNDLNYIEKYISYTLDLCTVEYQEIVRYLINDIFEQEFMENINKILLNNRGVESIKKMILYFPEKILENYREEMETQKNPNEGEEIKNDIQKFRSEIKKNIKNSRSVKKFLKEIKQDISILNVGIKDCGKELQKEDWIKEAIQVRFIKNFLPRIYMDMKVCSDILEFRQKYGRYKTSLLLGVKRQWVVGERKKEIILNYIIYKMDVVDFSQVMMESEKYYAELYSDKVTIKHINEYVNYAKSYNDFKKILNIFESQEFSDDQDKLSFVENILKAMSEPRIYDIDIREMLNFSKTLIQCLKRKGMSENEKVICGNYGIRIIKKVIIENKELFRKILCVLFKITKIDELHQKLSFSDINEFHDILKEIDPTHQYGKLEDKGDKLLSIKKYYSDLQIELKKEKYKTVGVDFENIFSDINIVFEICEFWNNIDGELHDEELDDDEEEDMSLKKYFILDGIDSFKDIVFDNISNLEQALKVLNEFHDSDKLNFSVVLLRLLYQIVLRSEQNSNWFDNQEKNISRLIEEMVKELYSGDGCMCVYDKDVVDNIKIYQYKFKEYCESDSKA